VKLGVLEVLMVSTDAVGGDRGRGVSLLANGNENLGSLLGIL
jgi:hypothetical protein